MRSIGLDLRPWVEAGLLRIWAARPSAYGLETHLSILAELIEEKRPSVAVIDGIASLSNWIPSTEVNTEVISIVARKIDLFKSRGITSVITTLGQGEEVSTVTVASMVDTWLLLRNTESPQRHRARGPPGGRAGSRSTPSGRRSNGSTFARATWLPTSRRTGQRWRRGAGPTPCRTTESRYERAAHRK